ncbi:PP2C family protein-serine/threonine phosphatase [Methylococcus capsulatus]|uniref:PP2C family protein-serine/threonine phosphatase n=1 Tax=Methylococcus capsulatus TaxID=414 RepID=UPI001C52C6DD|nr:SpoIIE family protein phosphatase [Methylococcus capsulatus]QXP87862.1 SpoIIE family protein phosphatase [Methylococcus capsulatus]QXP92398.1 SpoIIE family protein phosphatase [Methylococcus capsulatus]UQN12884.1 SpoIIE family protein phosphatase [Methylococcus capsulatus]
MRILLVDDDPIAVLAVAVYLRKLGYEVTSARDGREALERFRSQRFEFVISDWNMPHLNGEELCRQVRSLKLPHYVYFILLTGRDDKDSLLRGMEAGADDFLVKPVDREELRARIRAGERILRLEQQLDQRGRLLEDMNRELKQAYQTIRNDLATAAAIQKSLLPEPWTLPDLEVRSLFVASDFLAGDMFGYFPLDDRRVGLFQLDVSGHGVSAALISVALSKCLLQSRSLDVTAEGPPAPTCGSLPPNRMLEELNRFFAGQPEANSYFATMIYALLDRETGRLDLSTAGHPPPLMWKGETGDIVESGVRGLPLGVLADRRYACESHRLAAGDRFFAYSDGITECMNPAGEAFGAGRFRRLLEETASLPLAEAIGCIEASLSDWRGQGSYTDDISLVVIERK